MNEITSTELETAILAEIRFAHPNESLAVHYSRFLGMVLAHTPKETLEKILANRKEECARCGEIVLPSTHAPIGCDI